MNIHTNLRAGMSFAECNLQRNYIKRAAQSGDCSALGWQAQQPSYSTQLPSYPQTSYPTQLPSYPAYVPPSRPASGGGYYAGVYYADRSGACG